MSERGESLGPVNALGGERWLGLRACLIGARGGLGPSAERPPNTRVQRTRLSPSALRSPLTRCPLGRLAAMLVAAATLPIASLAGEGVPDCVPLRLSKPVADLVVPILKARAAAYSRQENGKLRYDEQSAAAVEYRQRFEHLLGTQGAEANEALATLIWFYIGEHPAEEWRCEVLRRSRPMIAPLKKWAACRPALERIALPDSDRLASVSISSLLSDIEAGKACAGQ